jgi:hypothetical protein
MVHACCTPLAMKERIFAESKAMGARFIRVDVELGAIFPAGSAGAPNWGRLDEVVALSRQYGLPVLGILLGMPGSPAAPDPVEFGRMAGAVAERARGAIDHWEVLNEPDGSWAFEGTPEDYARLLRACHDAIKARAPGAKIALGGLMIPDNPRWLARVFATPGADAIHAFDIASANLRDTTGRLPGRLAGWRAWLAKHGFTGPVWVTEHGYSDELAFQNDPAFRGGEAAQAAFLTESVLGLAAAGADQVFVTFRDNLWERWLTEGVVEIGEGPPHSARRKPAFAAMRRLVDNWPALAAAHAERTSHESAFRTAKAGAAAGAAMLRWERTLARAARRRLTRLRMRLLRAPPSPARALLRRRVARANARLRRHLDGVGWAKAITRDYRVRATLHRQRALELAAVVAGG